MLSHNQIKQGNVYTYQVPQNSANYVVRMALTSKGLWICIQESFMQWKLTISQELVTQTVAKASGSKQNINYKQFISAVVTALKKEGQRWSIGIMTPIQLEMLRGGNSSKQSNTNKLYLILSEKQKKLHLPFTFALQQLSDKDKIIQAIRTMKQQLDQLRVNNDKSQSSFSILSQSVLAGDQLKIQNQQIKKKIKIYQQSLTQKRGAVQIDNILRQKNNLQLLAQTKKRQEARQITRLKNFHSLMERQINQLKNQVDLINRQLLLLEDNMGNPAKLKSHAMRVLKSYQNDLRTSKKVLMKQTKDIQALKRNILNSKNNEKKHMAKIKQIQTQIQQAKKKANIKQISNRLHSPGNSKNGGSSQGGSLKAPSVASDQSDKMRTRNKVQTNNLVRQNLLNRTSQNKPQKNQRSLSGSGAKNQLLKTTPNINTQLIPRKTEYKPPVRPVVSSHLMNNNQTGTRQSPARRTSKQNDWNSAKSSSAQIKKRQFSPAQKQKQKQAMQRLTGGANRVQNGSKPPTVNTSSSNKNITKPVVNRNTASLSKKDTSKDNNAKDILNRMKEVKAQYNSRSKNSAAKQQGIAAKVAELTSKKQIQ